MKNWKMKIIAFILMLTLTLTLGQIKYVFASSPTGIVDAIEEKTYSNVTLEDSFMDDTILVVLNKAASVDSREYRPNDFSEIECYKVEDLTKSTVQKIQTQISGNETSDSLMEFDTENFRRILKITLIEKGKANVISAIKSLEKRSDVISAEPDYIDEISLKAPNDTYLSNQWAVNKISLPSAWDITTGSATIKVGIIDTGIDATHPDLINRIDRELSANFSSDFTTALEDAIGHGTHVAGIIGAQGNNALGITGACWNVGLVSLRVANASGGLPISNVINAIIYATNNNIQILNYSGGGYVNNPTREQAIINYPGLFVCAAGNDSKNCDTNPHFPSSHRLDNLIAVGSSTNLDQMSWFSNYGITTVDIFAPGSSIISTYPTALCTSSTHDSTHVANGYHSLSGTSMASPYVAGVAALLLSKYPFLDSTTVRRIILNNADIVLDGNNNSVFGNLCTSGGRLNADKVLNSTTYSSIYLDCHHGSSSKSAVLTASGEALYQIDIKCNSTYQFKAVASSAIQMTLYDSNMNPVNSSPIMTNSNKTGLFLETLTGGVYYLKITFASVNATGNITTTFQPNSEQIWIGATKDVLTNIHEGQSEFYLYNYKPQFLQLTLIATKNGVVSYPEGVITVRDVNGDVLEKFAFGDYNYQAITPTGSNNIIVYFSSVSYYHIEISFSDNTVGTLTLKLDYIDSQTIDAFELNEHADTTLEVTSGSLLIGDDINSLVINQAGKYRFDISYNVTQVSDLLLVIIKQNISNNNLVTQTILDDYLINRTSNSFQITKNLEPGTYYVGYFNGRGNGTMNIDVTKVVNQSGSSVFMNDPNASQAGSEVYLNGGNYLGNTITQGFTRLIYLQNNAPSLSRLDYYWYSSNENVATVSQYGTVLAMAVDVDTTVKIMAVYKNDSSKVFVQEFIIKVETKNHSGYLIDIHYDMTIRAGYSQSIVLDNRAPINILQLYTWNTYDNAYDNEASVNALGVVTPKVAGIGQTITIKGVYKLNPRIWILVHIKIIA